MTSVSPSGSTSSLVISLNDQLEWQQGARSHSPRTPTAPEIMRSLRKSSPITPSRWNESLNTEQGTAVAGFEALSKLVENQNVRLARIRGDYLCLVDGSSLPLRTLLPLQVRVTERTEDMMDSTSETLVHLTVGSAWLSVLAEHTYESQLASLLRSRKGFSDIVIDDRRVINRYLLGNLSMCGLKASSLWIDTSEVDSLEREKGLAELATDSDDILSVRVKKRLQQQNLADRKTMLQDQQNRLRKLLAREFQRVHATTKPAAPQAAPSRSGAADVSHVVANMLKRFKSKNGTPIDTPPETVATIQPDRSIQCGNSASNLQLDLLAGKLRALKVEWNRVGDKLKTTVEAQLVLERKIKRLRYEYTDILDKPVFRIEESEASKAVSV